VFTGGIARSQSALPAEGGRGNRLGEMGVPGLETAEISLFEPF
jgi:hypothetical protein